MKSSPSTPTQSRVLAIDPGFDRLGIALLEKVSGKEKVLYSECFETDKKASHSSRLFSLGERLRKLIKEWAPQELAIETLFFNQNTTSALKVAEARGVILYEAERSGLHLYEYSPQAIKIAVTGYGKATKADMQKMVTRLVKLQSIDKKRVDDELDAIAVGITHLASKKRI